MNVETKPTNGKKSVPWFKKPYNPKDPLDIPTQFRRALWTEEQHAQNKKAWEELFRAERLKAEAKQREQEALRAQYQKEQAEHDARRSERQAKREERRKRKAMKQEASFKVLEALENGAETILQFQKATGLEKRLIRQGLRILLKSGKAVKVEGAKRRYKSAFGGTKTLKRKTLFERVIEKRVRPKLRKDLE